MTYSAQLSHLKFGTPDRDGFVALTGFCSAGSEAKWLFNEPFEINVSVFVRDDHGVISLDAKRADADRARRDHLDISPGCRRRLGGKAL